MLQIPFFTSWTQVGLQVYLPARQDRKRISGKSKTRNAIHIHGNGRRKIVERVVYNMDK